MSNDLMIFDIQPRAPFDKASFMRWYSEHTK